MFLVITSSLSGALSRFFSEGAQILKEQQVLGQGTTGRENCQKTLLPKNWQSLDCASIQDLNAGRPDVIT